MSDLDDQIRTLDARIAELEVQVAEWKILKTSVAQLKELRDGPVQGERSKVSHRSMEHRKEQVSKALASNPKATNQQIADDLGLTAARVSQIRKAMKTG